jgi:exosortase A
MNAQVDTAHIGVRQLEGTSQRWVVGSVLMLVAGIFFLYWPSAQALMQLWGDTEKTTYTHGWMIAGSTLWLIARRRVEINSTAITPHLAAAILLLPLSVTWLIAVRAGIQIVHLVLLPALMWTAVWAIFGRRVAASVSLPIFFLLLGMPLWDSVNSWLQWGTVHACDLLLGLTGIPAYVEGNLVHLRVGTFEVAGGCSGLHFFIVALALAVLYGEIGRDSVKTRLLFVLLALALAMLTNWIRVYVIIVAGHLTAMQHPLVHTHYGFGWCIFAVMMAAFFLVARRFPQTMRSSIDGGFTSANAVSWHRCVTGVLLLIAVPVFAWLSPLGAASLPAENAAALAPTWARMTDTSGAIVDAWHPRFIGADRETVSRFENADHEDVQMYVATYAFQKQGKELVGYDNSLLDESIETVISEAEIASPPSIERVLQSHRGESVIRYSYRIGSMRTVNDRKAQLWYAVASLMRPVTSQVIALRSPCLPDCDAARNRIQNFDTALSNASTSQ